MDAHLLLQEGEGIWLESAQVNSEGRMVAVTGGPAAAGWAFAVSRNGGGPLCSLLLRLVFRNCLQ